MLFLSSSFFSSLGGPDFKEEHPFLNILLPHLLAKQKYSFPNMILPKATTTDDISPSCDHHIPVTDRRDTRESCRAGNQRLPVLEGHPQVVVQVQAMQSTRADRVPGVPYPLDLG